MSLPHSASRSRKNRFPVSLNQRIDRRLLSYCAAATAAGVSLLALPQPGQAEIVYTSANVKIPPNGSFELDLNHDGIIDFRIQDQFGTCGYALLCWYQTLRVLAAAPNGVISNPYQGFFGIYARDLSRGSKIGSSQKFVGSAVMDHCKATQTKSNLSAYFSGSFVRGGYLGMAFTINGQTHYGWARFSNSVNWRCHARVVLTGYAYETLPGVPILAGEWKSFNASMTEHPRNSLGGLALGNVGREVWRREEVEAGSTGK